MSFKLFLCTMVMVLGASVAQAQNQAYVYKDSVYAKLQGYPQKQQALDSLQGVYTQEVQAQKQGLQKQYAALTEAYAPKQGETIEQLKTRMSAMDAEKLNLLQEEDKLLETRIKSYNKQLEQQHQQNIEPYNKAVNNALESYAKKNKLDYIWFMEAIKQQLGYVNKSKDITQVIVEMVNKEL